MQNFGLSILWFWISYILVTCVGIVHTIINIYIFGMKPMDENGMGEGYEATKPWHPLYNIILFTIFGFLYMNGMDDPTIFEALITGAIWVGICIVFDVFGWVLIKHPWSLSFKEFYVDYQPWITLIYLAIFAGPVLGYFLHSFDRSQFVGGEPNTQRADEKTSALNFWFAISKEKGFGNCFPKTFLYDRIQNLSFAT